MNLYSVPSLMLHPGPTPKELVSSPVHGPCLLGWSLELLILLLLQNPCVDLVHHLTFSWTTDGRCFLWSFLSCRQLCHFATLLFPSCLASLSSCLDPGSASLLQTQLMVTRSGLTPVSSSELLDLPCSLPVPIPYSSFRRGRRR